MRPLGGQRTNVIVGVHGLAVQAATHAGIARLDDVAAVRNAVFSTSRAQPAQRPQSEATPSWSRSSLMLLHPPTTARWMSASRTALQMHTYMVIAAYLVRMSLPCRVRHKR